MFTKYFVLIFDAKFYVPLHFIENLDFGSRFVQFYPRELTFKIIIKYLPCTNFHKLFPKNDIIRPTLETKFEGMYFTKGRIHRSHFYLTKLNDFVLKDLT